MFYLTFRESQVQLFFAEVVYIVCTHQFFLRMKGPLSYNKVLSGQGITGKIKHGRGMATVAGCYKNVTSRV